MKNAFVFALAIIGGSVVVVFVIGAILAANDSNTNYVRDDYEVQQVETDYLPPTNSKSDYIGLDEENAFMEGCTQYAPKSDCQCMFNYLDQNLTNAEFIDWAGLPDPANSPAGQRAINNCI